jgi:hypothetical protein
MRSASIGGLGLFRLIARDFYSNTTQRVASLADGRSTTFAKILLG